MLTAKRDYKLYILCSFQQSVKIFLVFLVKAICTVNCKTLSCFRCVLCVLSQHSRWKPMLLPFSLFATRWAEPQSLQLTVTHVHNLYWYVFANHIHVLLLRVILRSPYVAAEFLKRSQYKQMVGRAGRAGIDGMGESILILQDKDINMVKNQVFFNACIKLYCIVLYGWICLLQAKILLCAPMEKCCSNLLHDGGRGLLSLVLSLIGLKVCEMFWSSDNWEICLV